MTRARGPRAIEFTSQSPAAAAATCGVSASGGGRAIRWVTPAPHDAGG